MAERSILFSAPMVLAIVEGRKTQTRRVLPPDGKYRSELVCPADGGPSRCFLGVPGDSLYVRERCWILGRWTRNGLTKSGRQRWRFRADPERRVRFDAPHALAPRRAPDGQDGPLGWVMRLPRYMPRWASRLTLLVKSVRVERLQDISEADAIAEGARELPLQEGEPGAWWCFDVANRDTYGRDPIAAFRKGWDTINGKRAPWDSNPWVWVVEFERRG